MSNFRIFCSGWVIASSLLLILSRFGMGPEPDLIRMLKSLIVSVDWGFAAVVIFGDRTPRP